MADFQNVGNFDAGVFTPKLGGVAPSGSSFTMDAAGIASGGAFLTSELEKRDPLIRKPLTSVTYARDIPIQTGGGWVDYVTAMNVAYGITGGSGSGADESEKCIGKERFSGGYDQGNRRGIIR